MKEKRKSSFAGYFVRQRRILYHVLSFYFFLAVEVALVVAAFVALLGCGLGYLCSPFRLARLLVALQFHNLQTSLKA